MYLSDCFTELMGYVASFISDEDNGRYSYEQVRKEILEYIQKSIILLEKNGFSQEDYALSRFAVLSWIDEVVMQSSWEGKLQWQKEPLQRVYYQTTMGGVEFYNQLETLTPRQGEVREVYYMCMALGFMGKYCMEGNDSVRDGIKSGCLKNLVGSSEGIPKGSREELFPDVYKGELVADGKGNKPSYSFLPAVFGMTPVAVFGFLFFLYRFILNNETLLMLGAK